MCNSIKHGFRLFRDGQQGFYLLDVLAASALSAMIGALVLSVMMASLRTRQQLQEQTDQYESLRIPTQMIIQDARVAKRLGGSGSSICMYSTIPDRTRDRIRIGGVYYWLCNNGIEYYFSEDGTTLYRATKSGGVQVEGENPPIVAQNLVPGVSWIDVSSDPQNNYSAKVYLETPPLRGQGHGAHIQFEIYTRNKE